MTTDIEELKYPIGRFTFRLATDESILDGINRIAALPAKLDVAVSGLSHDSLNTVYRPGGWTIRQVIHHLPDSHLNAYVRFKLAITEDQPVIRPYLEDRWAECEEARTAPVKLSIDLLEALHARWVAFLRTLKPGDFERAYFHPENNRIFKLGEVVSMYAWHGEHHLAHILSAMRNPR